MRFVVKAATLWIAVGVLALGLTACVGTPSSQATNGPPESVESGTPSSDSSDSQTPAAGVAPSPDPTSAPAFVPGGTAEENRPIFDRANQAFFIQAGNVIPDGRGVVDNLVSAGFDKKDMQITADRTAIDLPVDSLIFSVLQGDECLIGQFSALGYSTIIAPQLTTGSCLIGRTRTIDW